MMRGTRALWWFKLGKEEEEIYREGGDGFAVPPLILVPPMVGQKLSGAHSIVHCCRPRAFDQMALQQEDPHLT